MTPSHSHPPDQGVGRPVSLANQRPAYPISAPALTRHVLYRIPETLNPRWRDHGDERRHAWKRLLEPINQLLADYHRDAGVRNYRPFWIREDQIEGPGRLRLASDTANFQLHDARHPNGYRANLRIDINLETFALTFFVDDIAPQSKLGRLIDADVNGENPNPDSAFDHFWSGAFDGGPADHAAKLGQVLHGAGATSAGPFAEFRGIILPACKGPFFQPGSEPFLTDAIAEASSHSRGLSEGVQRFISEREGLIRSVVVRRDIDPTETNDSTEAIVCGMLDGRVLYAAPLGRANANRNEVRFLVAYDGRSSAQLGRFLRRLQVMGELRLSALMDLDSPQTFNLYKASQELRRLGKQVDRIGQDRIGGGEIRLARPRPDPPIPDGPNEGWPALVRFIRTVMGPEPQPSRFRTLINRRLADPWQRYKLRLKLERFAQLSGYTIQSMNVDYASLAKYAEGGITYRVERSKYYADAFKSRLEDLRVVRIEGWQPYDEFVRRYAYQLYDLIDGIGRRYEALGRRIDRLLYLYQSTSIGTLQRRAEDIAILAGLYYGSHVVEEGLEIRQPSLAALVKLLATLSALIVIVDFALLGRFMRHWLIHSLKRGSSRWRHLLPLPAEEDVLRVSDDRGE